MGIPTDKNALLMFPSAPNNLELIELESLYSSVVWRLNPTEEYGTTPNPNPKFFTGIPIAI